MESLDSSLQLRRVFSTNHSFHINDLMKYVMLRIYLFLNDFSDIREGILKYR